MDSKGSRGNVRCRLAGVNSGVLNNGTTGDTIGTGSGTSNDPSAGTAATGGGASGAAARGKE